MQSADPRNSTRVNWHLTLVAALGILLTWPAIWCGWPDLGHDSMNHARWLAEFAAQVRAGEWYPRWLTEANSGLGSPTFFYYPPLGHYLSMPFLRLWAPGSPAAWHSLGLCCALVLIASGIVVYFWLMRWVGMRGALWGALVYIVVPWHTAIDLYNRGAWAEFCGFLWMPLALLGADRLIESRRGAVLLIAAAYALLVLTHLPTAELLTPVLLGYVLFLGPRERRVRLALQTGCAMVLGLGIAAVYFLPAVLQQDAASVHILGAPGFYDYRKWFLGADIHSIQDFKMRVLVVTASMVVAGAAAFYFAWPANNRGANRRRMVFWLAVSFGCLFFMVPISGFLWHAIGPLAAISFPYRFNTVLSLAVAVFWAAAMGMPGRRSRWAFVLACTIGTLWLTATGWAASRAFLRWRVDPKGSAMLQESEHLKREPYEYLPRWALSAQHGGIEVPLANLPGRGLRLESASHSPVPGSASVVGWDPRRAVLNVQTPQPARLLVGQFYYPGWQARKLDDQRVLPVVPSAGDGLLLVDLPAGTYQIALTLETRAPERIGLAVSAVSCLLALILGILSFGVYGRRRPAQASMSPVALSHRG